MYKYRQAWIAWLLMPVFFSCATYHERAQPYYDGLKANNYQQASRLLQRNKLIQARRNKLLYYLEKGTVAHLLHMYDSSNTYFNLADQFMESGGSVWDVAMGTLTNPMMQPYRGEDFERFMVHYYKALNYLYLQKPDDALVEARRITLTNNAQKDKFNDKTNRYSQDAFSLIMQGMLYEAANDINNAFISYRNAADLFLRQPGHIYYGVTIPEQLQLDLLRTADKMGFADQVNYYEKQFGITYKRKPALAGGELVLFVENGMAPFKKEDNYFFTLIKNEGGFFFTDNNKLFNIPIDFSVGINASNLSVNDIGVFRLAMPSYVVGPSSNAQFETTVEGEVLNSQKIQDINYVATHVLSERTIKEMSLALSRLLLKKLVEREVKKEDKTAGAVLQAVNLLVEKADTRNWQSLPATISYLRIPLKTGEQQVQISSGGKAITTISVTGNGGMQFYNYRKMY